MMGDIIAYALMGTLILSFLLISRGYAILVNRALRSEDRRGSLKRIWDWRGQEHLPDARALRLIYTAAAVGVVGIVALIVLLAAPNPVASPTSIEDLPPDRAGRWLEPGLLLPDLC